MPCVKAVAKESTLGGTKSDGESEGSLSESFLRLVMNMITLVKIISDSMRGCLS